MLWTVQHCWPEGARFKLNFYMHWVKLLLLQPGEPPVTILSIEEQGDSILMVLYRITHFPFAEELRPAGPGLLSPFYADDEAFDGLA